MIKKIKIMQLVTNQPFPSQSVAPNFQCMIMDFTLGEGTFIIFYG